VDKLSIEGGVPLAGEIRVSGAKNAALPLLCAALLAPEPLTLTNVPRLNDVRTMESLLSQMGVALEASPAAGTVTLDASRIDWPLAPYELVKTMRASILALGPLVARCGEARVSLPGGCAIGLRPVDQHVKGLQAMGAEIDLTHGYIHAKGRLTGARIVFDMVTVTGTENLLMAATLAEGTTVLENAAREPEVVDLARCLNAMGAKIEGAGSPTIEIEGVEGLHGAHHRVIPDRIEAGTYLVAGAITGGRVRVEGCRPEHLTALLDALYRSGIGMERGPDWLETQPRDATRDRLRPTDVTTQPYPGFPTDLQAQWMALMCLADGVSVITERIFPDRYMHLAELLRLGARIRRQETAAVVEGVPALSGASIMASDLRASAALVLAGLVARGQTQVHRVYHIDRGYERIEERVARLGGTIHREALVGAQAG
jgi:UDP-N-acetylglucosamine 1-carboxyvinyltransferase